MAAPKLYRENVLKASNFREYESNSTPLDKKCNMTKYEMLALSACYSDELSSMKKKTMTSDRNRKKFYSLLEKYDAFRMLDLIRKTLPKVSTLDTVVKNVGELGDVNSDDYLSTIIKVNKEIEMCLNPDGLNWEKDRLSERANYVVVMLWSFYDLTKLELSIWYNRIMQYACFSANPKISSIPIQFIIPDLQDTYEYLTEDNKEQIKTYYRDITKILTDPNLSKSPDITTLVRSLWNKGSHAIEKKDLQEICDYPALVSILAEVCSNFYGGYSSKKKRDAASDPEFDPSVEKVKRRKLDVVPVKTDKPMPKLALTNKIKCIQSFMLEKTQPITVYTESTIVARLMLSTNKFCSKDPLGLMILIDKKNPPVHFVNVPRLVSCFYKPRYCNPKLDRNTYCALFLGWFPVWLTITSYDIVIYMPSVHTYNDDNDLFNKTTKKFEIANILALEPDFETCDVFQQKVFGVDLLPTLIGRVAVIMCILLGNHDIDVVEIDESQVTQFRSGAYLVLQDVFKISSLYLEKSNSTIFQPLLAVCNTGKDNETIYTLDFFKSMFFDLLKSLAGPMSSISKNVLEM